MVQWTLNPANWISSLRKRPPTETPKDPEEQPKSKKIKLDLDLVKKISSGSGIGQARITRLNTGQGYRLTITNYLSTTVKGGEVGSITVRGEAVTILDADNNVVFTAERGDLITIQDNQTDGMSTAMTIIGAAVDDTESSLKITGSNMYATNFANNAVFAVAREEKKESAGQNTEKVHVKVSPSTQKTQDAGASQSESMVASPILVPQPQPVMQFNNNNNSTTRVTPTTDCDGIINGNINGHTVFLRKIGSGLMNDTRAVHWPTSTRQTGSGLLNETRTIGLSIDPRKPCIHCNCNGRNPRREDQNQDSRKEKGFSAVNV